MSTPLPIEKHLSELVDFVQQNPVTLVEASPGSGKTTMVPLALMNTYAGKILVLEPRRLATRWAAERVAKLAQTILGGKVGYLYRFDNKTSPDTRLIYLTEGSFLQYLKGNPELKGVDAIVIDEFHERHLTTDMAFGLFVTLTKKLARAPRLLIMSATLDDTPIRSHFPQLKKFEVNLPIYPLELIDPPADVEWHKRDFEKKVLWGIQEAFKYPGDMLVFLPGLGEIKKIESILKERLVGHEVMLLQLHGQESSPDHLLMHPQNKRRIILASNIAESSITIPGVQIVIDAGLQREAIYSAWSGQTELVTNLCSQSSAIQRAGRAARTGPGVCIRLYSKDDFAKREKFTVAEIHKTELASVLLELAYWQQSADTFPWPESPKSELVKKALQQLHQLGALKENQLTEIGKKMLQVPLPVRHARVWTEALQNGKRESFQETCHLIAQMLEKGSEVKRLSSRLTQFPVQGGSETHPEKFFLTGFADHIARGRNHDVITVTGETYPLSHEVKKHWDPKRNFWLVMAINPLHKSVTQLLALEDQWIEAMASISEENIFDEKRQKMIRRQTWKLGALTIKTIDLLSQDKADGTLLSIKANEWLAQFKESAEYIRWSLFSQHLYPHKPLDEFEWELFLEEFLLEEQLPTQEVEKNFIHRLREELQLYFDATFQTKLNDIFPVHFNLHEKRKCEIHYEMNQPPWIEAYIQDFFGQKRHPALMDGKLPLVLHLWGPHGRAQQVTSDLMGFWQRHYPELKKELARDYPRHFWPDDPQTAVPMLRKPKPQ